MQQAIKNPHFKKIWEEVNWKIRHPEAKSLEEALILEKEYDDCLLFFNDCLFTHNTVSGIRSAIIALRTANISEAKRYYIMGNDSDCKILGRPITLDDILLIFVEKTSDKLQDFSAKHVRCYAIDFVGDWQLTKPLHEQRPKTWEEISKLIK